MMRKRDIFSKAVVVIAVAVLVVALPSAIVDTYQKRRIYLFSRQFLDELLLRFTGPGRPRFLPQRLIAIVLGCRSGLADARGGHPPFIYRLVTDSGNRKDLLDSGLSAVGNLVAMGIVLDAVAQFLIYGLVHPGEAVVFGPVLICFSRMQYLAALRTGYHLCGNTAFKRNAYVANLRIPTDLRWGSAVPSLDLYQKDR
jgi:hypothetical protein